MFPRALLACLLAAVLCGCGAGAALFAPLTGTVTGHVQIRACGGANGTGASACQAQPYAGGALEFQLTPPTGKGSDRVVTTDATGHYSIALAPGTWTVTPVASASSQRLQRLPAFAGAIGGPRQVTVTAGKTLTVDFAYTIELM
jgi:hypothetical protein